MDKFTFGKYLRELRGNKSTRNIQDISGVSKSYISLLEQGKRDIPSPDVIRKLALAYNVPYEELLKLAGYLDKKFIVKKLELLRGNRSYEEYANYLNMDPILLERFELGIDIPEQSIIEYISNIENINSNYFYEVDITATEATMTNNSKSDFMDISIRHWLENPNNYPYIEFAYKAYKQGIPKELLDKVDISIKLK